MKKFLPIKSYSQNFVKVRMFIPVLKYILLNIVYLVHQVDLSLSLKNGRTGFFETDVTLSQLSN